MADKALTTPQNTEHLMELTEYMQNAEQKTIFELEERMIAARDRVQFLVRRRCLWEEYCTCKIRSQMVNLARSSVRQIAHTQLTMSEIKLNTETFNWHYRMPKIFEDHHEIITRGRREAEEHLKVCRKLCCVYMCDECSLSLSISAQLRRERFNTELESYEKQLQEFQSFDDLQEVRRYHKKAQALRNRLEEAQTKIEGFNMEEDAFEWQRTQYPLKSQLVNTLEPYQKLYGTILEFNTKHE